MKTTRKFVNRTSTYYPPIVPISTSKWGEYARMGNLNYSIKEMAKIGFTIESITEDEGREIEKDFTERRAESKRIAEENWMKSLTEIELTFESGEAITSVSHFKSNAENTGQITQGSDAHEAIVLINGKKHIGRKHWSNSGMGVFAGENIKDALGDFIGDIHFEDEKTYIRYKQQ